MWPMSQPRYVVPPTITYPSPSDRADKSLYSTYQTPLQLVARGRAPESPNKENSTASSSSTTTSSRILTIKGMAPAALALRDWGGNPRTALSISEKVSAYEAMLGSLLPSPNSSERATAVFGDGNNVKAVVQALKRGRAWKCVVSDTVPFPSLPCVSVCWKQGPIGIRWNDLVEGTHLVNHFRHARELTTKGALLKNIANRFTMDKKCAFNHIPLSFLISENTQKTDLGNFGKMFGLVQAAYSKYAASPEGQAGTYKKLTANGLTLPSTFGGTVWILKPTSASRGRGIHVFSTLAELHKLLQKAKKEKVTAQRMKWVWIDRPAGDTKANILAASMNKKRRNKWLGYETESSDEDTQPLPSIQMKGVSPKARSHSTTPTTQGSGYFKLRSGNANQPLAVSQWVIQKYIERPLLVDGRKFDIRVWVVITPSLHVYMCEQGYIRTAAKKYNLTPQTNDDQFMHLCNNAIQKLGTEYCKYEDGNHLSFKRFQEYLRAMGKTKTMTEDLIPRMADLIRSSIIATKQYFLRPCGSHGLFRQVSFELFGYDFMVDENMDVYLIEVNSNPCLAESSQIVKDLLPQMLDEMFRLCVTPWFPRSQMLPPRRDLELFKLLMCIKHHRDTRSQSNGGRSSPSPRRRQLSPNRTSSNSPPMRRGRSPSAGPRPRRPPGSDPRCTHCYLP